MVGFNLEDVIDKNSRAEKLRIVQHGVVAIMSYIHLVPCSWGPFLRIISRNGEMRFGLKHDFMN